MIVKPEFVIVKVDVGKYPVFREQVIVDGDPVKEILLNDGFRNLPVTVKEKPELRLERISFPVLVEFREEWIPVDLFLEPSSHSHALARSSHSDVFPTPMTPSMARKLKLEGRMVLISIVIFHCF